MQSLFRLFVLSTMFLGVTASAQDWETYRSEDYGFEMLVPAGTNFEEQEGEGGWGALYAEVEGVELYALGKMGSEEKAKAIEKYAVKATGVPAKAWKPFQKGKDSNGFKWFRAYKAKHKGKLLYGAAGVGSKGSYLIVLSTTAKDFKENKAAYEKWYKSVKLL